jgi:hypothetical protein
MKHKRRVNQVFSKLSADTTLQSHPPSMDKKIPFVAVAVARLLHPRIQEGEFRIKERERVMQATPLLPPFVLKTLSLWNPARGNGKLPRMFLMLRFK